MRPAMLRELHEARPFVPFALTLADGRKLSVSHDKFLYVFPSGRGAVITTPDDRFTLIDTLLITAVDVDPKYRRRRQQRPRKS